ncbi:MAG: hypothetical protein CSA95_02255 [Bacteroidetes bacterium]|nr:MAG: hypothetical protein CSA95_02255 [Bacteroidota bacterium]
MDFLWVILAGVFMVVGFVGCIVPILPGPPIAYIGLLLMQLTHPRPFDLNFMLIMAVVVVGVTVIDNVIPVYGTKKMGGSKKGVWGATIGLIIGLFFAPIGLIVGPFAGAFIGEMMGGKDTHTAIKSGLGSLLGFLMGTGLKLIVSGWIFARYIAAIPSVW